MSRYKSGTKRSRVSKLVLVIVAILIFVAIAGIFYVRTTYNNKLKAVSASQKAQLVTIPLGSTVKETGVILEKAGVIRSGWAFEWYVRNNNLRDKIQAGTYNLRPSQSIPDIANVLTQGKVATDLVTILPAQRLDQIKKALIAAGFSDAVVTDALNPIHYANHPALVDKPKGASLEGYLYPESFQKTAQTSAEIVVKGSLDEMQKHLTPDLRAGIVRQGLTVHEGIVLASIIEQEVSNVDDKKIVAQVFLRRLRADIPLQSDATAPYGAIIAGQQPSLTYESAFNTYSHKGLPPGPISNVGKSSLEAVANPAQTDYLYFVAGDDGKTYFSHTLSEHQQLTKEHCKKLCSS